MSDFLLRNFIYGIFVLVMILVFLIDFFSERSRLCKKLNQYLPIYVAFPLMLLATMLALKLQFGNIFPKEVTTGNFIEVPTALLFLALIASFSTFALGILTVVVGIKTKKAQ